MKLTWWQWLLVPPYIAICLALTPFYLPVWLALALMPLHAWLLRRNRTALWEFPFDRLNFWAWAVSTRLVYLVLKQLFFYTNVLSWCLSKDGLWRQLNRKGG